MNNYKDGIGNRIKQIRQHIKLTQQQFAEKLGVSRSHISNVENGNEMPSNSLLLLISAIFPVNHDWILYENGEMLYSHTEDENHINEGRLNKIISRLKDLYKLTDYWVIDYLLDLLDSELVLDQDCAHNPNDTIIVMADLIKELNQMTTSNSIDEKKISKYKLYQLIDKIYEMNE